MNKTLTLQEFYTEYLPKKDNPLVLLPQMGHFNVFQRGIFCKRLTQIHRTDFYKIALVIGTGILHLEDKKIEVKGRALIFYNPMTPHMWEPISEKQEGYFCLFNNTFIAPAMNDNNFRNSPLYNTNLNPVYDLTKDQAKELDMLFKKMMQEVDGDYVKKYELLSHYLHILIHEAHKMQPSSSSSDKYSSASSRISSLFIEMLERQFPVDSTEQSLKLKTPHDFADLLSVHVNHLNRAVKEVTGRSTTEIISARIANEAKALLKHSDNSVAQIAYSLGFEHPSNFNIFFKKQTSKTPGMLRSRA
ncbi:AraC family transcriptional regulator [Sphingobacteriaceae bacterium]|nr:AraC family transcriptional regulator [Sphingobacteriaceae bacterium]